MKKLYPLLSILFLIYWGCEKELEEDTTPPTVSITSLVSGQFVSEIVTISVTTQDDDGISKVEFFVGDSLHLIDTETPYEYDWITTTYEDGSEHIIKVKSYDNSDNSTESSPLSCIVDNSTSVPQGGNITSVTYTITEMMVEWEESTDGDFNDYKVLFSDTENGNKDTLETFTDISTTSYTITEFDPLIENWFWVKVTDTLGLSRIGTGMSNSIDSEPYSVNVTSVNYDLETMDITWEEYVPNVNRINQMNINTRSSVTNDFQSYELLHSESEEGTYTSIVVITDQSITSYSLTEFDPTKENWFKVIVTDYWGLHSIGTGLSNDIDSPPISSEISQILYHNGFQIKWLKSNESDFKSYKLYMSNDDEMSNPNLVYETTDMVDTNYVVNNVNQDEYYQIICEDYWGLESISNIEILYNEVELWGQYYSVRNTYEINLTNNGLFGSIPKEVGYLTNLTNLNLYWNQLTGSIPSQLGNLINLEYLNLGENQLTGSIPLELSFLSNLVEISLRENQLTGSIPSVLGNLNNLVFLDLYGNDLTHEIPTEIGNLINLNKLYLYNNQLTGEIPLEIGNLTNLNSLKLSGNQFSGEIPSEIGNLTNLTSLYLNDNYFSGVVPETICNLDWNNLNYYSFNNNQFCPPYPNCIYNVGNQDISNCNDVEIFGEIYPIESTIEIDLSNSGLSGQIPPEIGNLINLRSLILDGNQLTGTIPQEIGFLTNLETLHLHNNQLSGEIPPEIGNLLDLFHLNLSYNQLSGEIPSEIGNLSFYLTSLYLNDNQLSGQIPESICNLNWINVPFFEYSFDNNQLCPPNPTCVYNIGNQDISNCDGVVEIFGEWYSTDYTTGLYLSNSGISGPIPPEIWELSGLTELWLSGNQLTGSIPPEIGNLTNLEYLNLSNNQLTGSIPPEIGNLTNLNILYLGNNQLTGPIPPELGDLTSIFALYLNDNQLSGLIPDEICIHDGYWDPNFDNNQLCPPYPSCIEDYVGEQDTSNCD